jgi:hypothetical protein
MAMQKAFMVAGSMYYGRVSAGNAETASSLFQTSQNRQIDLPCLAELNRPMPLQYDVF